VKAQSAPTVDTDAAASKGSGGSGRYFTNPPIRRSDECSQAERSDATNILYGSRARCTVSFITSTSCSRNVVIVLSRCLEFAATDARHSLTR